MAQRLAMRRPSKLLLLLLLSRRRPCNQKAIVSRQILKYKTITWHAITLLANGVIVVLSKCSKSRNNIMNTLDINCRRDVLSYWLLLTILNTKVMQEVTFQSFEFLSFSTRQSTALSVSFSTSSF
jgi:hypothetical protein